ncbi:hypothetical protein EG68_09024 [Paragonimus skrjabini miyazakii]|uniref:Uncharacterized protein n=1 Tax=Paragonimus skrjabini miyazakii TaxID=59628 RepID=A0A8S9YIV5_9TREM|nr:hypothetical protein EG68_09024 [Paragonimus skrjabini miyazakii]
MSYNPPISKPYDGYPVGAEVVYKMKQVAVAFALTFTMLFLACSVEAYTMLIPIDYDDDTGEPYVQFDGKRYSLKEDNFLEFEDDTQCQVTLDLRVPEDDELINKKGYIGASRLCPQNFV